MKHFWIALILLTLTVALTVGNSVFVQYEVKTLTELAETKGAKQTADRFARVEPYLALTVHHTVLEQAKTAVLEMTVYEHTDRADYLAARERFVASLEEVAEGEKISISSIF